VTRSAAATSRRDGRWEGRGQPRWCIRRCGAAASCPEWCIRPAAPRPDVHCRCAARGRGYAGTVACWCIRRSVLPLPARSGASAPPRRAPPRPPRPPRPARSRARSRARPGRRQPAPLGGWCWVWSSAPASAGWRHWTSCGPSARRLRARLRVSAQLLAQLRPSGGAPHRSSACSSGRPCAKCCARTAARTAGDAALGVVCGTAVYGARSRTGLGIRRSAVGAGRCDRTAAAHRGRHRMDVQGSSACGGSGAKWSSGYAAPMGHSLGYGGPPRPGRGSGPAGPM
jgi:hypothetical protein